MDKRIGYEERFYVALKRITAYMTTKQLQRASSGQYGLEYTEALEMAYENVIEEAKYVLRGYKRKPHTSLGAATEVSVAPAASAAQKS